MADVKTHLERAEKALAKGKPAEALKEFLSVVEQQPGNDTARLMAADVCISLDRTAEAVDLISATFRRQAAAGESAKAIASYKKLARTADPHVDLKLEYAALVERSDRREAARAYREALQALDGDAVRLLGVLRRLSALETEPELLRRTGELALELGDHAAAAQAFFALGRAEQMAGRESAPWYERAYTADPSHQGAALAYGRNLLGSEAAVQALATAATSPNASPELRQTYARALLMSGKPLEAETFVWDAFEREAKEVDLVFDLVGALLETRAAKDAVRNARRLEKPATKAGGHAHFVDRLSELAAKHPPSVEFTAYLADIYNGAGRDDDYIRALETLFDLHFVSNDYIAAAEVLERLIDAAPFDAQHATRLEHLRAKIPARRAENLGRRLSFKAPILEPSPVEAERPAPLAPAAPVAGAPAGEPTVLENLMLQAEISMRYSLREKAQERLQVINRMFPGIEITNDRLRELYRQAGFTPQAAPAPAVLDTAAAAMEVSKRVARQATTKDILLVAVNEIGRHWQVSRCLVALGSAGKNPTHALEFCAPNIARSDAQQVVRLLQGLQPRLQEYGGLGASEARKLPALTHMLPVLEALQIDSLLAVPLLDGEQTIGVMVLEQCGATRSWTPNDHQVLKTIADQMVIALNNAKLRSLLKSLAVTEENSGLLKRSSYTDVMVAEVRRALQQNTPITVVLLRLGRSAAMLKLLGEQGVEELMEQTGRTIRSQMRHHDMAFRYERTTIALLLTEPFGNNIRGMVENLRRSLAAVKVPALEAAPALTVGVAEAIMNAAFAPEDIVTEVINRADDALRVARENAGDQTQVITPEMRARLASA